MEIHERERRGSCSGHRRATCPLTFEPLARFMGWQPCRLVGHKSCHLLAVSSCSRNKSGHVLVAMSAWTVIGVPCPVVFLPFSMNISGWQTGGSAGQPTSTCALFLSHYCTISGLTRFEYNLLWAIYKYDIYSAYIVERVKICAATRLIRKVFAAVSQFFLKLNFNLPAAGAKNDLQNVKVFHINSAQAQKKQKYEKLAKRT